MKPKIVILKPGPQRFPLQMELAYRAGKVRGTGRTLSIGSHGVLAELDKPVRVLGMVELSIDWPAELDGRCALQLYIEGAVLQVDAAGTEIEIHRHEFRTRGTLKARIWAESPVLRKVA